MATLNEHNLVTRLHNGDPTAFDDLYRQYSGYVAFICLKFCDSKEDAEEAMQDTFLDVHAMADTLRADTLLALIRRIAVCKCYRKRNQSRQLLAIRADIDLAAHEEQNDDFLPERYLHNKEQRDELLRIIMALPKMQWETVYLYYYASFGTEEIARLQNCSTSNVRKTLRNARVSIKSKLESTQRGVPIKPIAGVALVSLGAVLLVEESVFAASYVATTVAVAATTTAAVGTVSAIKGYLAAACIVTLVAVSAATYYILLPDDPAPAPVPAATQPPPTEPETTAAPTTTPPPTTVPITTPPATTTPATTSPPMQPPTPAPTPPPTAAPTPEPVSIDHTSAILTALAAAASAEDVAQIIAQFNFAYDQLIRGSGEVYRFYVTNAGSGDILIGIAADEYGTFLWMRYAFFDGGVMPRNVITLLHFME